MGLFGTLLTVLCLICVTFCRRDEAPYEDFNKRGIYYTLPELGFSTGELEPFIDSATVQAHHGFHHQQYVDKLNTVLKQWRTELPQDTLAKGSLIEMIQNPARVPDKYRATISSQGGGLVNHGIYWSVMSGNPYQKDRRPSAKLSGDIDTAFGNFDKFRDAFSTTAKSLSPGFIWLSRDAKGELAITTSQGGDSPLCKGRHPLLVIDMAEHAYYLRHQYRRQNYIYDWWKVIDWQKVARLDMWWADLAQNTTGPQEEL